MPSNKHIHLITRRFGFAMDRTWSFEQEAPIRVLMRQGL